MFKSRLMGQSLHRANQDGVKILHWMGGRSRNMKVAVHCWDHVRANGHGERHSNWVIEKSST